MTEIWQMSLSEQSAAVAKGDLSPSEIVETAISRIEELDCKTNACVTLMAEAAMANAQSATTEIVNGRRLSPIHGLPVGLKDIFDTAGVLTAGGSKTTQSRIPDKDATSVAKLRERQAGSYLQS